MQMQWKFIVKIKDAKTGEQRQVCNKTFQTIFSLIRFFSDRALYFALNLLSLIQKSWPEFGNLWLGSRLEIPMPLAVHWNNFLIFFSSCTKYTKWKIWFWYFFGSEVNDEDILISKCSRLCLDLPDSLFTSFRWEF